MVLDRTTVINTILSFYPCVEATAARNLAKAKVIQSLKGKTQKQRKPWKLSLAVSKDLSKGQRPVYGTEGKKTRPTKSPLAAHWTMLEACRHLLTAASLPILSFLY